MTTEISEKAKALSLISLALKVVQDKSEESKNEFNFAFHEVAQTMNRMLEEIKSTPTSTKSTQKKVPEWQPGGAIEKKITYDVMQTILQKPDIKDRLSDISKLIKKGPSPDSKRQLIYNTILFGGVCVLFAGAIVGTIITFGISIIFGIFATIGVSVVFGFPIIMAPVYWVKSINLVVTDIKENDKLKKKIEQLAIIQGDIIEAILSKPFSYQTAHFAILVRVAYGLETNTPSFIQNIINEINGKPGDNREYLKRIIYFDTNKSYNIFNINTRFGFSTYIREKNKVTLAEAYVIASEYQSALSRVDLRDMEGREEIKEEIIKIIADFKIVIPKIVTMTEDTINTIQTLNEMQTPPPLPENAIHFFKEMGFSTVYETYEQSFRNTNALSPSRRRE